MNDLIQVVAGVSSLALDAAQPMENIFIYGAVTLLAKVRVAEGYTQTKTSTDGDAIIVHSKTQRRDWKGIQPSSRLLGSNPLKPGSGCGALTLIDKEVKATLAMYVDHSC